MIQPIVEGHGEVEAVPILLRRLMHEVAGIHNMAAGRPIRRPRSRLVCEETLRQTIQLAKTRSDCEAILILFDSDDDCPVELAPTIERWAVDEGRGLPCAVVMAHREYEAWFLACLELFRGKHGILKNAPVYPDPEAPRDAKGRLTQAMRPGLSYSQTADQPRLTAQFDLATAHARCRSFRRLVSVFGRLTSAAGHELPTVWPPAAWSA